MRLNSYCKDELMMVAEWVMAQVPAISLVVT